MSTFHGLEMAKQALFAQRSALYTTGHNISNANTPGYSRQRVNFETLAPFPTASRNRPEIPGQMGTGVEAGTVQRIRTKYLDHQFRAENSNTGYWETKADAFDRLENLMNEPSESGLSETMDQFWESLNVLAVNPENSGARSVVAQRGLSVAETFNYLSDTLHSIQSDLKEQIDVTVKDANSLIRQIDSLNKQIKNVEPHGYLPNDLYDERDRLIDELSGIVNIKVTYEDSSKSSLAIADGLVTIEVVDNEGKSFQNPVQLINGNPNSSGSTYQEFNVSYDDKKNPSAVSQVLVGQYDENGTFTETKGLAFSAEAFRSNGSLLGFIESYGYETIDASGNPIVMGEYPEMIANLDDMAKEFATAFNVQHKKGEDFISGPEVDFFAFKPGIAGAGTITINEQILDNPDYIAAALKGNAGDGDNAALLADLFDEPLAGLDNVSANDYYKSLIGDLGVRAQEANRMKDNTTILRSQVEGQRMSVSSVSLDEEMANMIKFQHAYNAAARSMTAVDELIDRVINNMGLVGR